MNATMPASFDSMKGSGVSQRRVSSGHSAGQPICAAAASFAEQSQLCTTHDTSAW